MAALNVVVQARALHSIERVAQWYRINLNDTASKHFLEDLFSAIETLSQMPTIGRQEMSYQNRKDYHSFLFHPKYRIVYRYTQTTLYIVAIRATMKNR